MAFIFTGTRKVLVVSLFEEEFASPVTTDACGTAAGMVKAL